MWMRGGGADFCNGFGFVGADLNRFPKRGLEPENYANFEYFRFCAFFRGFFAFDFCWGHFWGPASANLRSAWGSAFFCARIDVFRGEGFLDHGGAFCKLWMRVLGGGCTFSDVLRGVGSCFFFGGVYRSPFDSNEIPKKV